MNLSERHRSSSEATSSATLTRQVLGDARELIELEIGLAVQELKAELVAAKRAAIAGAVAFVAIVLGLASLIIALVLALGGQALHALAVAAALFVLAAGISVYAFGLVPKKPLEKTLARLKDDADRLKEHVA